MLKNPESHLNVKVSALTESICQPAEDSAVRRASPRFHCAKLLVIQSQFSNSELQYREKPAFYRSINVSR